MAAAACKVTLGYMKDMETILSAPVACSSMQGCLPADLPLTTQDETSVTRLLPFGGDCWHPTLTEVMAISVLAGRRDAVACRLHQHRGAPGLRIGSSAQARAVAARHRAARTSSTAIRCLVWRDHAHFCPCSILGW